MIDKIKFITKKLVTFDEMISKGFNFKAEIVVNSKVFIQELKKLSYTNRDNVIIDVGDIRQYIISGSAVYTGKNKYQESEYIEFNPAKMKASDFNKVYDICIQCSEKISRIDYCIDLNISIEILYHHMVFEKRHVLERQFIGKKFETIYLGSSSGEQIKVYDKLKELKIKDKNFHIIRIERSKKDLNLMTFQDILVDYSSMYDEIEYYDFDDLDVYKKAFIDLYGINVFVKYAKSQKTWKRYKDKIYVRKSNLKDIVNSEIHNYFGCKTWFLSYNDMYIKNYANEELITRLYNETIMKDKLSKYIYSKTGETYDLRELLLSHYKDYAGLVNFVTFKSEYKWVLNNPRKKIHCLYNNSGKGGKYRNEINEILTRKGLLVD